MAKYDAREAMTEKLIDDMAADLLRLNALGGERDAIRALTSCGYRMGDVAILAPSALLRALLTIVQKRTG